MVPLLFRISYKSEDKTYKMTEIEKLKFDQNKLKPGENNDDNGSEALSNDSDVK